MIYTCICVTILIITGIVSDVSAFTIFLRSFVFGTISFLLVFYAQFLLKNNIIGDDVFDNDEYSSKTKGHAVNVVVDDSYTNHEDGMTKDSLNSSDDIEKVEYNTNRRIDSALLDNTMNKNGFSDIAETSVDLSDEIKRSQKTANGNPEEYSNVLKTWIYDAQSKKA